MKIEDESASRDLPPLPQELATSTTNLTALHLFGETLLPRLFVGSIRLIVINMLIFGSGCPVFSFNSAAKEIIRVYEEDLVKRRQSAACSVHSQRIASVGALRSSGPLCWPSSSVHFVQIWCSSPLLVSMGFGLHHLCARRMTLWCLYA